MSFLRKTGNVWRAKRELIQFVFLAARGNAWHGVVGLNKYLGNELALIWYVCFHPLASFTCLFLLVSMINPYYIFFSPFTLFRSWHPEIRAPGLEPSTTLVMSLLVDWRYCEFLVALLYHLESLRSKLTFSESTAQSPASNSLLKSWFIGLWKCLQKEKRACVESFQSRKSALKARGLAQPSLEGKVAGNASTRRWRGEELAQALPMGWRILHLQGVWGTLASTSTSACAPLKNA